MNTSSGTETALKKRMPEEKAGHPFFSDKPDLHRHKGKEQKRLRVREKYDTNESRDKDYITFGRDKA